MRTSKKKSFIGPLRQHQEEFFFRLIGSKIDPCTSKRHAFDMHTSSSWISVTVVLSAIFSPIPSMGMPMPCSLLSFAFKSASSARTLAFEDVCASILLCNIFPFGFVWNYVHYNDEELKNSGLQLPFSFVPVYFYKNFWDLVYGNTSAHKKLKKNMKKIRCISANLNTFYW